MVKVIRNQKRLPSGSDAFENSDSDMFTQQHQQATQTTLFTTTDCATVTPTAAAMSPKQQQQHRQSFVKKSSQLLRSGGGGGGSNSLASTTSGSSSSSASSKNIDYEIVVMLEGNIETTGASCHIRTSYLPQEILFGFRFVPIYPKFNKFEYMFDFSRFDMVEPVQPHLFHLNIDNHLNKTVYDAKKEMKNCQLTYHNTIGKMTTGDCNNFKPVSILTILSTFKANEPQQPKFESNVKENTHDKSLNLNQTVLVMDDVDGGKEPPPEISKAQGRFTIVPVRDKLIDKLLIVRNKRSMLKRVGTLSPSKLNLNHKSAAAAGSLRQGRANSTPPAFMSCQPLITSASVAAKMTKLATMDAAALPSALVVPTTTTNATTTPDSGSPSSVSIASQPFTFEYNENISRHSLVA